MTLTTKPSLFHSDPSGAITPYIHVLFYFARPNVYPLATSSKMTEYLGFNDLEFIRVPVQRFSARGVPWIKWVPIGMPTLPPGVLDCVCYLYPSEDAARQGEQFGGTGFLVALPSERFPKQVQHHYIVTNWHVACRDGCSVARINTTDGMSDIIAYGPDDWQFDPRLDIAVVPVLLKRGFHRYKLIRTDTFMTAKRATELELGPGEDVFMVGRFIDHDGGARNQPAVRFGHISVMPTPIGSQPNGGRADSFCLDMHSRAGYSGSPVFVYRTPGSDLRDQLKSGPDAEILVAGTNLLKFLGIHFAQFPEMWEIGKRSSARESFPAEPLITEGEYVKGLSGMTCVLPAWSILEVLNMPKLKTIRSVMDNLWQKRLEEEGFPPEPESTGANDGSNPSHKEDFTALLVAAAKTKKPDR